MPYHYYLGYSTDFSTATQEKLFQALALMDREWTTDGLPDHYYARSGPYVIADWKKLYARSPEIPEGVCPIYVSAQKTFNVSTLEVAEWVAKCIGYWEMYPEKTRATSERIASGTHNLKEIRRKNREKKTEKRQESRAAAASHTTPLSPQEIAFIRSAMSHDPRFKSDRTKFMSNALRNLGKGRAAMIHMLFAKFRGKKVACVCSGIPSIGLDSLKAWRDVDPEHRILISDLPTPDTNVKTVMHLYDALADALDEIPKPYSILND